MKVVILFAVILCFTSSTYTQENQKAESLFDGTFNEWEGDTDKTWRIENGTIVAGSSESPAPRNEFLSTTRTFSDFELRLKFKTTGTEKINCGIQFRSKRPDDQSNLPLYEMIGYQADIGDNVHGSLYDESRRRKFLFEASKVDQAKVIAAIPNDGWQTYRIRAVGNRIQLWVNGIQTAAYTESDDSIWNSGVIGLQIHGNMVGTVAYKDIEIVDLADSKPDVTIEDMAWIAGHWTGDAMGGQFEETWNPPLGGEMMGMFKLVKDGKVSFYEILTIVPKDDSYVLRLKHFSKGLVGWEEKDKSVEFPFVSASEDAVCFKGLKFVKIGDDKLTIEVAVGDGDEVQTMEFNATRAEKQD
jgi:hypothetical protein